MQQSRRARPLARQPPPPTVSMFERRPRHLASLPSADVRLGGWSATAQNTSASRGWTIPSSTKTGCCFAAVSSIVTVTPCASGWSIELVSAKHPPEEMPCSTTGDTMRFAFLSTTNRSNVFKSRTIPAPHRCTDCDVEASHKRAPVAMPPRSRRVRRHRPSASNARAVE